MHAWGRHVCVTIAAGALLTGYLIRSAREPDRKGVRINFGYFGEIGNPHTAYRHLRLGFVCGSFISIFLSRLLRRMCVEIHLENRESKLAGS